MVVSLFFFFNVTAPTEIYTLSLHDALPIFLQAELTRIHRATGKTIVFVTHDIEEALRLATLIAIMDRDRKSTRLNSSHTVISYAVFCLKKKKSKYKIRLIHVQIQ